MEYFINVTGGLGYNISLIRTIAFLKKKDPSIKVSVCTPYWDIFASSSVFETVYKAEEFRDFIFDAKEKGAKIIIHRLYDDEDFIYKKVNYSEAWCKLLGFTDVLPKKDTEGNGTSLPLELDLLNTKFPNALETKNKIISELKGQKFIFVQFWGGQSPLGLNQGYNIETESLKRAYPINLAQQFISKFKEAHPDVAIIQYTLPNEPKLEGCITFEAPYVVYYLLSKEKSCLGFVSIDSSLQHLISGNCPGVVIWGHTLPTSFGYLMNDNIVQKCRREDILYFTQLGASGAKIDYIDPAELLKHADEMISPTKAK